MARETGERQIFRSIDIIHSRVTSGSQVAAAWSVYKQAEVGKSLDHLHFIALDADFTARRGSLIRV